MTYAETSSNIFRKLNIPPDTFRERTHFIHVVREGLPGTAVKEAVALFGTREPFYRIFNSTPGNFSRLYRRSRLDQRDTEDLLDALRVYLQALRIWGNDESVREWLNARLPALDGQRPLDLFDTAAGRDWVRQILTSIEYGEFS